MTHSTIPELGPVTDREYLIHLGVLTAPAQQPQRATMEIVFTKDRANNVKHRLRQQGMTLKSWCAANHFKYQTASDVLRGIRKGNFGEGRDVAEKLLLL